MGHVLRRRLLFGVLVGGLLLGATAIQPGNALAGISTSPGSHSRTAALTSYYCMGKHLDEIVIE